MVGAYSQIEIIKTLQKKSLSLFTLSDFARLFAIDNRNTVYKKIQRLEKKGIVKKLIKGKYLFLLNKPSEFVIANFLYQPSYVSLESALSFYGVMTGFPYQITSVTTNKTRAFMVEDKEYQYARIDQGMFWGFEKKEAFLIASPEKALIDYLYLAFKGLRSSALDEFDLSLVERGKMVESYKMIKNRSFLKFLKGLIEQ